MSNLQVFEPQTRKTDVSLAGFLTAFHLIITTIVNYYVKEPYMDEIFHIGQTRSYCEGNYTWNPMITTPPALYIIAMPLCGSERYVNSIIYFFAVLGFCRFRRYFNPDEVTLSVITVSILPILLQSSSLFYTDLLSLAAVIWGFSITSPFPAALCFTLATLTRQTNIIWAGTYGLIYILNNLDINEVKKSIINSLMKLWPFELLASGFLGFIYWNNFQIVLGDAHAHQPVFHVPQLLYLIGFSAAHMWPHLLILDHFNYVYEKMREFKTVAVTLTCAGSIAYYTYDHPYLLADNRHYTFYIWRRLLAMEEVRVSIAPFYVSFLFYLNIIAENVPNMLKLVYLVSSFLVLVPAHLFEMRYFIIPFVILRLSIISKSKLPIIAEILSNFALFSVVFYIFLFKTFVWESEPNKLQRFMF